MNNKYTKIIKDVINNMNGIFNYGRYTLVGK